MGLLHRDLHISDFEPIYATGTYTRETPKPFQFQMGLCLHDRLSDQLTSPSAIFASRIIKYQIKPVVQNKTSKVHPG